MSTEEDKNCYLVLEDGSVFEGKSFGARRQIEGEIGEFFFFFLLIIIFLIYIN